MLAQLLDGGETVVGHLLLADLQQGGHVAIRPAPDKQELHYLEAHELAAVLPLANHVAETFFDGLRFQHAPLLAAGHARRGLVMVKLLLQDIARAVGRRVQWMAARAPQMIRYLVRSNGEKISLKLTAVVEMGQAVEKADERLLDDVLARGAVAQPPLDKGEQPAFITGNERLPGTRIAQADLLDEQAVSFGRHRTCRSRTVKASIVKAVHPAVQSASRGEQGRLSKKGTGLLKSPVPF